MQEESLGGKFIFEQDLRACEQALANPADIEASGLLSKNDSYCPFCLPGWRETAISPEETMI